MVGLLVLLLLDYLGHLPVLGRWLLQWHDLGRPLRGSCVAGLGLPTRGSCVVQRLCLAFLPFPCEPLDTETVSTLCMVDVSVLYDSG